MVDPGSTLGEVAAVTRVAPESAPKILEKNDILMSIILRQIKFSVGILVQHGNSGHFK